MSHVCFPVKKEKKRKKGINLFVNPYHSCIFKHVDKENVCRKKAIVLSQCATRVL